MENWRQIPGFPGYEVSDLGNVRSTERLIKTSNGQVRFYAGKCLSPSVAHDGYPQINLRSDGKAFAARSHALVALAFIGPRPDGMEVCHNNGCPADPRLSNIRYDTPKANSADKDKHGTSLKLGRHPGARLTEDDVASIRELIRQGVKQARIAKDYGVSRTNISAIATGRSWSTDQTTPRRSAGPVLFGRAA